MFLVTNFIKKKYFKILIYVTFSWIKLSIFSGFNSFLNALKINKICNVILLLLLILMMLLSFK